MKQNLMNKKTNEKFWQRFLADKGGKTSKDAALTLLNDPDLATLKPCLDFVSANWADPLRPALMSLSCEAVGGKSEDTKQAAVALTLMNLSFYLWDDAIDKAPYRLFKPTFYGKFGSDAAIILGGVASAKGFNILSKMELNKKRKEAINQEVWTLWATMAKAESAALNSRRREYTSKDKLQKIKEEAKANLATCLRIGAIIGSASKTEVLHLGKYGEYLGAAIDLKNDFRVATNLTVELSQKIGTGALPYSLLWAKEHSKVIEEMLTKMRKKENVEPNDTAELVSSLLETGIKEALARKIKRLTKKAGEELSQLKNNEATRTLKDFVEDQPHLFEASLQLGR
jgi:geranylgeranyl pyrophosphate synthase